MSYKFHFKGECSSCGEDIEFLSVDRYDSTCAECYAKSPRPGGDKFWQTFNWPDRTLFPDEVPHMMKLWKDVLSVSPSGSGKWGLR